MVKVRNLGKEFRDSPTGNREVREKIQRYKINTDF